MQFRQFLIRSQEKRAKPPDVTKTRRTWRKLCLGLNVATGQIVAVVVFFVVSAQIGALLDQVVGPVASFTGDGRGGPSQRRTFGH
jgi:hypothetical protein